MSVKRMHGEARREDPRRNSFIVVTTLTSGLAVFTVVVLLTSPPIETASLTNPEPLWLFGIGGLVVVAALGLVVVGGLLISRARARHDRSPLSEAELEAGFQTFTIVRAALLEALGLLGCLAFQVSGEALGLLVAVGCVVGMLLRLPTDDHYERFSRNVTRPR